MVRIPFTALHVVSPVRHDVGRKRLKNDRESSRGFTGTRRRGLRPIQVQKTPNDELQGEEGGGCALWNESANIAPNAFNNNRRRERGNRLRNDTVKFDYFRSANGIG